MVTKIGILSLIGGLFIGLFTGISNFMGANNYWVDLTIFKIIGTDKAESIIEFTSIAFLQNSLDYMIYDMPFAGFLIIIGIIFLFISLFTKSH